MMIKALCLTLLLGFSVTSAFGAEDLDKFDYDPSKIPVSEQGTADLGELQGVPTPLVEYIIDSSGSMGQILTGKKTKIFVMKKLLSRYLVSQWTEKTSSGMRVIGSRRKKDCKDNYLAIPPGNAKLGLIEGMVKSMDPVGMTPLYDSMKEAYKDLEKYDGPKRVVIFTDGEETCGKDPCKLSEEFKNKNVDLKFFVVAFGLQGQQETLQKLKCIGDLHQADDEEQLDKMFEDLDKDLNPNKNLFVDSPEPQATVMLFRAETPNEIYRRFQASYGIQVPPGRYYAVVNLKPKYRFKEFIVPPNKKVTLKVKGEAKFKANFIDGLMKVELLNKNRKVVKRFNSDAVVSLPPGKWNFRFYRDPFYEKVVNNYLVVPNAEYEYTIEEAGVAYVEDPQVKGIYVFGNRGIMMGNHVTNFPLVLGKGVYEIRVDDKCIFKDIIMGSNKEVVKLQCSKVKK
ncbi:VWA domain-containing protein [Bdellovibrio sp. KM01]|uniref:vWA domain-containing protein n=1 Tax=Bdellovibrio sp. KM01 TaxID=2748865 RepID=UPI0015E98591|nr:VWA domain-containing protein [Bdellovibrio sp. KM01]QLY24805.1 VWA domain-containing protein [Bdellovibrio sp. KM01]